MPLHLSAVASNALSTVVRTTNGVRGNLKPREGSEIITGLEYRELQTRPSITGWTPELVELVGAEADNGILSGLADLCEAIESDDRVKGVMQQLTFGTFGLPLTFAGGDPELTEELRGEDGAPGEWDSMHPESELNKIYRRGVILGVSPFQRVPLPRLYGQPQRYQLRAWHPKWLSYDHYAASGSHWRMQTREGMKRVLPGGQFGLFMPYGQDRPWNEGAWRALAFPWLVKRFSLEDRANQGEVVGSPTWVGTSTQGGTERQRQRFLDELRKLGRNGRIVLPDGWKLELVEAEGRTWDIFTESIKWSDQAITISIASQLSTTEGSAGFDSGKPQQEILGSVTRYFAKQISQCLYYQSTRPWARANTGDARDAPYGYWNTERSQGSKATTAQTAGTAITALDAGLKASGRRVDGEAFAKEFGIPTVELEDADADTSGVQLAPTDQVTLMTVNEARASFGVGPLLLPNGQPDPDGEMMVEAYRAKNGDDAPGLPKKAGDTGKPPQKTPKKPKGRPGPPRSDDE